MTLGFFFVFLYEIPQQDSMFFTIGEESGTGGFFLRDGIVRARYGFVSPMAFSQYSWFIALVIIANNNFKKITKIIFTVLMLALIFYCNTRAGIFLTIVTVGVYFYTFLKLYKIKFYNFLAIIVISGGIILKNIISAQTANHKNETMSDELRVLLLLDGFTKAKEHFLLGVSGHYFSPRAEDWYDFENSWISLIVCFGLIGIFVLILLLKKMVFSTTQKFLLYMIIPWLGYSAIFPILQEPTAVFITWYIIAAILVLEKWKVINGRE